jgi:hypothetical protein
MVSPARVAQAGTQEASFLVCGLYGAKGDFMELANKAMLIPLPSLYHRPLNHFQTTLIHARRREVHNRYHHTMRSQASIPAHCQPAVGT